MASRCWSLLVGSRRLQGNRGVFAASDDQIIRQITMRHFPAGFTILHAAGGWFDPARRKFQREESRQILICAATLAAVRSWGRELGAALRQKELLIVELGRAISLK